MPKKDFQNWSRDKLLHEYKELLKRKKFGIVWEDRQEDAIEQNKSSLPILKNISDKTISTGENEIDHIFIEGENYHALSVLNYTHKKNVDVIYIDPPYNTGSKSWKYNNHYVEKDDRYRHSKWLSFMSKRLRLAKPLLSDRGVIIVAIDDYEHHTLRSLMDELLGEQNRMGTIVVVHNPRGRNDDRFFATMHEYLLVYAKNKDKANVKTFDFKEEELDEFNKHDDISAYAETSFMRTGNNSDRSTRPNLFYPIYYNQKSQELSLKKQKDYVQLLPINEKGEEKTWRWGEETFADRWQTELIVRKVKGSNRLFKKRRIIDIQGKKPKTVWYSPRYDASSNGITILNNILGNKHGFPYPKSLYAVADILELVSYSDSVILDFFAGSGTTGHAVLQLNKKDKGRRQFILCTDNEDNNETGKRIASDICYPRIKKVLLGYSTNKKKINGLGGNLRYYSTELIEGVKTDNDKRVLTSKCTEMLCLAESTFEEVFRKKDAFSIYQSDKKMTGIIYDEDTISLFKKELKRYKKPLVVYVFSYDHTYEEEDFENLENLQSVKPIPEVILNVYRKINKDLYKPRHL